MAISPTRTRRWTRVEYERLIDAGVFRPEVRREPLQTANVPLGWGYKVVTVLELGASVSPLAYPTARIQVADLLPHARYSR